MNKANAMGYGFWDQVKKKYKWLGNYLILVVFVEEDFMLRVKIFRNEGGKVEGDVNRWFNSEGIDKKVVFITQSESSGQITISIFFKA